MPMATPAGEGGAGAELDAPDWATGAGPVATIGGRGVAAAAGEEAEKAAEEEPYLGKALRRYALTAVAIVTLLVLIIVAT